MRLSSVQERGSIEMSRVMVLGVEDIVTFGIEECRLGKIGIKTVPYKRRVALTNLWCQYRR